MKKLAKRALVVVTAIGAMLAVGLTTTTVVHAVATEIESSEIEPYGQSVSVDGRDMNVLVAGNGPEDVVLLPGFGTASPVLDFEPLVADLSRDHRVIVVEPFGYGLSDGTDRERTTQNIVTEIHAALEALDVDNYVLMGHSIAGIYGIEFAARYPEEVTAFVGIDSSVPGQPNMDMQFPTGLLAAAKNLGLLRLAAAIAGDEGYSGPAYTERAREQIGMIANRNSLSPTYLDEMAHISSNFERALNTRFPSDLPLLLFVVADNVKNPDWLPLHERQALNANDGTVVPMDGEHYLHHTHAAEIADEFRAWEDEHVSQPE
ncbi:alpha/beta hydrolase [Microbacterium murale]|uniref:Pimeloyl-ACP methyl ester carboxylesterase n=1 Tax=Microbacterium murale TaxID=1081040 RepID=A0ABU0PF23_9MICO|nr:alpha/beta hydrolase [Microbacterium murale]MDQ0645532.1 pimeloyl-ACP methyl ester carboxylesterase [Microbacterium murale]